MKQLKLQFKSNYPMELRGCSRCVYRARGSLNIRGRGCAVDHNECLGDINEYNLFQPEQRYLNELNILETARERRTNIRLNGIWGRYIP